MRRRGLKARYAYARKRREVIEKVRARGKTELQIMLRARDGRAWGYDIIGLGTVKCPTLREVLRVEAYLRELVRSLDGCEIEGEESDSQILPDSKES